LVGNKSNQTSNHPIEVKEEEEDDNDNHNATNNEDPQVSDIGTTFGDGFQR
jgi:hypothetical protein